MVSESLKDDHKHRPTGFGVIPTPCSKAQWPNPTVGGRNPAPPKKPWNDDSPVNANKPWSIRPHTVLRLRRGLSLPCGISTFLQLAGRLDLPLRDGPGRVGEESGAGKKGGGRELF